MIKQNLKITKKKTREIVNKLKETSTYFLSPDNFWIYVAYRLVELLRNEYAIYSNELLYHFCEVGPGNRRFDPFIVEILYSSFFMQKYLDKKDIKLEGKWFLMASGDTGNTMLKIKEKLLAAILENSKTDNLFQLLKKELENIFKEDEYEIVGTSINKKMTYIEFKLITKKFKNGLLLRFYNTNEWIYPDSWQIWGLFEKARLDSLIPILIAPKIHGACFPLFKALGIFARAEHDLFIEKSLQEIRNIVLNKEENDYFFIKKILPCKIDCLSSTSNSERFLGIKQLLSMTIPKYYDVFAKNFTKATVKVNNFSLDKFSNIPNTEIKLEERMQRIKDLLKLKIGHFKTIKNMIKRNEMLIAWLEK